MTPYLLGQPEAGPSSCQLVVDPHEAMRCIPRGLSILCLRVHQAGQGKPGILNSLYEPLIKGPFGDLVGATLAMYVVVTA